MKAEAPTRRSALAVLLLGGAAGLASCQDPSTHVLLGQLYEPARDCVDPTTSIDIVGGPDPGFGCAPTCVVTPAGQNGGGNGVYVTTMCGPYAPLDDTSGAEPACAGALAALARSDVCASSPADSGAGGEGGD